jgi:hypothetical protein
MTYEISLAIHVHVTNEYCSFDCRTSTGQGIDTTVSVYENVNIFFYSVRNLVVAYTVAGLFSLFSVLIGMRALLANGVSHSSVFSAIIRTTRNPTIDAITYGQTLGAKPLDKNLTKTKLRFGVLAFEGERPHAGSRESGPYTAFGVPEEVSPLRKAQ